jgi:hypothetical protein
MAVLNQVGNALAGSTGTGAFVGATSPTLVTPILGAASASSISFTSTSGTIGTATNDSAAAGSVGELISSIIASGSAIGLTATTAANITSISLTAGDWDVFGNVGFLPAATTNIVYIYGWSSTTSVTVPDLSLYSSNQYSAAGLVPGVRYISFAIPTCRISLASTTTVYLSTQASFSVDTLSACGAIYARRRR